MQTVVIFVLVLSLLVFVHELGHFIFAKRAGILVREFAIGFGPKLFATKRGETLYSLRILPLGGYVRMAGEDAEMVEIKTGTMVYATQTPEGKLNHLYLFDPQGLEAESLVVGRLVEADLERQLYVVLEDADGHEAKYFLDPQANIHYSEKTELQIAPYDRQFGSKTAGQKAMTIFAGPLFNIVLTIILFAIYTFVTGIEDRLPVDQAIPDSPAAKAGIRENDMIVAINGKKVNTMDSLRYELLESKGKTVTITVDRNGQKLDFPVTPQKSGEVYQIGVYFNVNEMKRDATLWEAAIDGFRQTYDWSVMIMDGFGKLVTGQLGLKSLGGPVQMGSITGEAAKAGYESLIRWTALLSLNLGIFNLLPIPALDGSRLVFIGIEAVRGRPISPNKESLVHFIGFALLMMLMLVVTFNDIKKVFFT
ncbi:RIP metalloprotease RseP [Thermoactinomyces intermedius]|uniref:Zinc metalloprotease n=1 Tax=Thermoactinomyces intermedius TaxID=2024 RepID=A0A8I1DF23_THEIN|nr:RIP metalloprotease RseP [Thermoactinomyces intermedius]MBA4547411.1 RIP metalloprotease RseP [Thermoactinomyces intermedius]MBA4837657.1 RIP metalloprotease RseP [Thermoactinomyces intermedius]MBH8594361.1 RIP metalloprotease RseP [Thermoactinomyces intermedius]